VGPARLRGLAVFGLTVLPFTIPVLPVESFIDYQGKRSKPKAEETSRIGVLPQYYADQVG
jgi:hypothetical protein